MNRGGSRFLRLYLSARSRALLAAPLPADAFDWPPEPNGRGSEKLEHVIRRLDAFHAQIHFRLAAMMRGVGEVGPQPLKAGHLTILGANHRMQLFRSHGRDSLIAEV